MPAPTPAHDSAPTREQLLYWLHEAAEIEHNLMCCYLYAAFSLKLEDPAWSADEARAVAIWRRTITVVALEEMTHLCLVGNLMNALGAQVHLNRPMFPIESGPYPADFVIRLQPFSVATIEHFKFLERPHQQQMADGAGFEAQNRYQRHVPAGRLSPGARDYATVGELYATLRASLQALVAERGEAYVFLGDPARQVDATMAPLPGVCAVTNLASAEQALLTIVTQGEGAGDEHIDSHFCKFSRLGDELAALLAVRPGFEPAWPAAANPVMNRPFSDNGRVHIDHPINSQWLDIGNALYTTSLRCLLQGFAATDRTAKAAWLASSFALMRAVTPVGQGLAARPASLAPHSPHAGLTFTSLRTLATLPASSAPAFVAARIGELRDRAIALTPVPVAGESVSTWMGVIDTLGQQQARIAALSPAGAPAAATGAPQVEEAIAIAVAIPISHHVTHPVAASPSASPAQPAAERVVEVAHGKGATVFFEGKRCVHSRHCVLDAPSVFKANTPGEWIYPDTVPVEALVAVAHNCPSGAIRYERHDGGPAESAPLVNTLRIRENGPYAVHAPLTVAHQDDGFRATLCRCGQSGNKPFCDGSHVAAKFQATGEPPTGAADPLAARDGPLVVTPLYNGPLQVSGNLEICAGTGRTVARVTDTRLCRCGQSRNKPFCDGSHTGAGFEAAGD